MPSARRSSSWSRHSCMTARAAGVLKSSSSAAANRSQASVRRRFARVSKDLAEPARRGRPQPPCASSEKSSGLAPVPRQVEDEQRVTTPGVEDVAQRHDVALRLRHLLGSELEHAVVHPDVREAVPERARLRELVLVVREAQVEAAAVDLELRPEVLLGPSPSTRCASPVDLDPTASPTRRPRAASATSRARSRADPASARSTPARPCPRAARPTAGRTRVRRDAEVHVAARLVRARPRSTSSPMNATISGIVSVARGSTSGRPRPRSFVSSKNHSVACAESSRLAIPRRAASA